MKFKRLLLIAGLPVVATSAIGIALLIYFGEPHAIPAINGEAVTEAVHRYCVSQESRHLPLPIRLTLGDLVDAGFLRDADLGSPVARDYEIPLRALTEGSSPITIMHFPYR